ncbi:AsmA family protein [Photobacterium atrarenae]|uniref:AsmA family protein n=1 Tax=Photobacterium atrarenae TaxID=865757 RepID=A0ABY5GG07_9GAMM|nr:AsmA family protein [Photobacterium atrarenae]UTV27639.1 AsmA family protein [Photobacterium atrarenae]
MRLAGKLIATFIIISLLATTILLALLHTRHAAPLIDRLVNAFTPYHINTTTVRYHILKPWHLRLDELNIRLPAADAQPPEPITIARLELWFNPRHLLRPGWSFDTVLIDGLTLSSAAPLQTLPAIEATRLALTNFNWRSEDLTLANSKLQLNHWQSSPSASSYTYQGDVRLAADTIQWQQQTLENVLIDGQRDGEHWTLYGFSFRWHQANISGQAEYQPGPEARPLWRIRQLSLAGLNLQEPTLATWLSTRWHQYLSEAQPDISVERLDVLHSSLELPGLVLNSANLSLRDWHLDGGGLPAALWQQQEATLSLDADSLRWQDLVLDTPLAELAFRPQQVQLTGLSTKLLGGYLTTDGTLTPDTLALNQFTARNIQWELPRNWTDRLRHLSAPLSNISVQELKIGYTALTAPDPRWPFHLNGLNVSGYELQLKRRGQPGLWQGSLTASASSAGLNGVPVTESMLKMTSQAGQWQLERLTLSFEQGLMEAQGQMALVQEGMPWQLQLSSDSLPATVLPRWLQLPLMVDGMLDVTLNAQGLGQHATGLAYSLAGELNATLRQLRLNRQTTAQLWQQWQQPSPTWYAASQSPGTPSPQDSAAGSEKARKAAQQTELLQISPIRLQADRGRIQIQPIDIKGGSWSATLGGRWDLARPDAQQLELNAEQGCERLQRRWQGDQQSVSHTSCGNNI